MKRREWLALLAELGPDDLRRISRLVDRLVTAPANVKASADAMLDAGPLPATAEEARARTAAVTRYLEVRAAEH